MEVTIGPATRPLSQKSKGPAIGSRLVAQNRNANPNPNLNPNLNSNHNPNPNANLDPNLNPNVKTPQPDTTRPTFMAITYIA